MLVWLPLQPVSMKRRYPPCVSYAVMLPHGYDLNCVLHPLLESAKSHCQQLCIARPNVADHDALRIACIA